MNIANEMLDSVRDDPNLLQRVITGDEAWVYGYDVETKAQSSQWKLPHEPRPKKARQVRSNVKVLLTVFFDCRGVVHHEFLPQGRTVNKKYYLQVMRNLREAIRQKRPDLWKNKIGFCITITPLLTHRCLCANFLAQNNTLMMPQPPYSPDLAPCDFFLFPKLKRPMKGRRYATLDEIKTASKEELKNILKNDFLKCFEDWKNRWHKRYDDKAALHAARKMTQRFCGHRKCVGPVGCWDLRFLEYRSSIYASFLRRREEGKAKKRDKIEECENSSGRGSEEGTSTFISEVDIAREGVKGGSGPLGPGGRRASPNVAARMAMTSSQTSAQVLRGGRSFFRQHSKNPRTTLLELEQDTGISKTTIGRIVTEDLRLKKTPAKFIPRFLTNEQKLCRLATCEDMLEMTRTDPEWKDKIITGDETWVYGYDPETKRQSAEWRGQGEPRPKKSRILKSRNKVLLVAFLDNKGIVHHEYLPAGQTVIKEMYLSILRRLREAIRKKRPEKWTNGDWILHHDNARPHTAHLVTRFLAKNGTEILPQPPYSPDIAPNNFFLFPKLKAVLKGRHFDTREDIIEKSLLALKSIPKEAYKNCFDNWEKRWRWCVEARGDYFEKF
ncbi:hypothetical protein LAZ67_18001955 [Cordylochernes scorpioides]|uniref:Transposase n=1 Tax=Cordylochernes scorpioides TaxID=51811 RepID=A0ABY6LG71_9ARAC|nr:hypothetical protein LAZ67_18001955 [Cordylochernes scorpioides]